MAGATATTTPTKPIKTTKPTVSRFVGVRQRPSGRWVAEIKDSSQRVRLWLGTFDSPEEAARAYDEAARALRGENTRTNFALAPPNSSPSDSDIAFSSLERGVHFASLKAKLSKNLQGIITRTRDNKASKTRVSDHFTFASIFRPRSFNYRSGVDLKNIEKSVQPSFIVPRAADEQCWDSACASDSANYTKSSECTGFRRVGSSDSDGSDVGDVGLSERSFEDEMMGWIDDKELMVGEIESTMNKRCKVSSSVIVPPSFSLSEFFGGN